MGYMVNFVFVKAYSFHKIYVYFVGRYDSAKNVFTGFAHLLSYCDYSRNAIAGV